jgi:hypothetical protein
MSEHVRKRAMPQRGEFLYPGRLTRHANGRRAVRAAPHANAEGRETDSQASDATRFAHDFSRVPVHSGTRADSPTILEAARLGTSGAGGPLPHLDVIQKSFGRHDVSGIASHVDAAAAAGARMMGASAFTSGRHVAFAGEPSLHTAAHEAAHAVQQRGGVQLKAGVGEVGDVYERHADEVANRVAAGQSSETLLDAYAPRTQPASGRGGGIQMRAANTAYGTFEDVYYDKLTNTSDEPIGCEMYLRFTPNDKVDATKIGLTQAIKPTKEGALDAVDETKRKQAVTSGTGKDFYMDMYASSRSPIYGASVRGSGDADKLGGWDISSSVTPMSAADQASNAASGKKGVKYDGMGQYGHRKKSGATWETKPAELDDWPTRPGSVGAKNAGQYFETTALAIEGTQKDCYYGSVQWGWERDAAGTFKLVDFKAVTQGTPSANFLAAVKQWNASKTSANEETIDLPPGTQVYKTNKAMEVLAGTEKINLPVPTRVRIVSKGAAATDPWKVTIIDGPHINKVVSVDGTTLVAE